MADIRFKIKEFLFDSMFIECHDDTMLFDDGLMDSMGFLSLISYIEEQHGIKLRDDQLTESNERIDIVFIGSSSMRNGLRPSSFEVEYKKLTGKKLRTFVFGIGSLKTYAAIEGVIPLIQSRYHPSLISLEVSPWNLITFNDKSELFYNNFLKHFAI